MTTIGTCRVCKGFVHDDDEYVVKKNVHRNSYYHFHCYVYKQAKRLQEIWMKMGLYKNISEAEEYVEKEIIPYEIEHDHIIVGGDNNGTE